MRLCVNIHTRSDWNAAVLQSPGVKVHLAYTELLEFNRVQLLFLLKSASGARQSFFLLLPLRLLTAQKLADRIP